MENKAQDVFKGELQNSIATGKLKEDELFIGSIGQGGRAYLIPKEGSRIRSTDLLTEVVKDPATGKVKEYRPLFDNKVYEPIGGGKVRLKSR